MSSKKAQMAQRRNERRGQRTTSNIFSAFTQQEIQEFKEAFNMIDQNHDGFIDHDDLIDMMTSLGTQNVSDDEVSKMLSDAAGPVNFTMFLTMFSERLQTTDPGKVLLNAFRMFDEKETGFVSEDRLRHLLTSFCNRWSQEMVDELYSSPQLVDSRGFNYVEFVRRIKGYVALDNDEEQVRMKQMENDASQRRPSFHFLPEVLADLKRPSVDLSAIKAARENRRISKNEPIVSVPPLVSRISEESPGNTPPALRSSVAAAVAGNSSPPKSPLATTEYRTERNSPPHIGSGSSGSPVEIRPAQANKTSTRQEEKRQAAAPPVAPKLSASAMRQNFFNQTQAIAQDEERHDERKQEHHVESTFGNHPHLMPPKMFTASSSSSIHTLDQAPQDVKQTISEIKRVSISSASTAEIPQSNIPMPISGSKRQSQDYIYNQPIAPRVSFPNQCTDDTNLPPIRIEAKFENRINRDGPPSKTIMDVSPNLVAKTEAGPPKQNITASWRQQQQDQQQLREQAQSPGKLQLSSYNKSTESIGQAPAPEKKTYGSSDKLKSSSGNSLSSMGSTSGRPQNASGPQQLMLMQENPLSRQTPPFGYRMVASATTVAEETRTTSSSASSSKEGDPPSVQKLVAASESNIASASDMPPGYSGERKLSFAKIVLSQPANNQNNLMTASSMGSLPVRASITARCPPISRIKSIENNNNNAYSRSTDAATRAMSASMTAISNNNRATSVASPSLQQSGSNSPANRRGKTDF